jgi:hypothetical protein
MLGGPVAFIATFFISAPVPALSAGGLYVFGTSIVDAGSTQNALGGPGAIPCAFTGSVPPCDPAPASFGYFDGRFSQGPNAKDLLNAEIEGRIASATTEGGQNYSFGGARSVGGGLPDLWAPTSSMSPESQIPTPSA